MINQDECEVFPELNKPDLILHSTKLKDEPWIICNANQIRLIQSARISEYNLQANYVLAGNIDFENKDFTSIGDFTGTFDGNGKTISNVNIVSEGSGTTNIGFFQKIGSPIRPGRVTNLIIEQADLTIPSSVTSVVNAGILTGLVEHEDSVISAVTIRSSAVFGNKSVSVVQNLGGLVGSVKNGTIINARVNTSVSNGGASDDRMGGLVGNVVNDGMIQNSVSTGDVSNGGGGEDRMGGLVGEFAGKSIDRSIASGNVFSGGDAIDVMGGLIGLQEGLRENKFENCIATGDVHSGDAKIMVSMLPVCGVGMGHKCPNQNALGGLVGYVAGCLVDTPAQQITSYALGSLLSLGDSLGGLFGCFDSTSSHTNVENLYWNQQTSGLMAAIGNSPCLGNDGCTDQTTFQLVSATSLTNFNSPLWSYGNTSQYPGLTFTNEAGQTCTVRPIVTSGLDTNISAEFTICPDQINSNSFHPMCKTKPSGCP